MLGIFSGNIMGNGTQFLASILALPPLCQGVQAKRPKYRWTFAFVSLGEVLPEGGATGFGMAYFRGKELVTSSYSIESHPILDEILVARASGPDAHGEAACQAADGKGLRPECEISNDTPLGRRPTSFHWRMGRRPSPSRHCSCWFWLCQA